MASLGPISTWTEPATRTLGRSEQLNRLGKWVSTTVHRVVGTGRMKEALAGTWLAHPAHPMLTDVTIGAWTSAAILELVGGERGRPGADRLIGVGILSAVPTALSGLSDLTDIVEDDERSIGTAHALVNVGGLALWTLAYVARKSGLRRTGRSLTLTAMALTTGAGFLGGHLSYRMGLGVDQTAFDHRFEEWTEVMPDADLAEGAPRRVMVSGTNVFLYRTGGRILALDNRCSHRGGPLHKGTVEADRVTCPWHVSSFRLDDGAVLRGPATAPQPVYEVRVEKATIQIRERVGS